MAILNFWLIMAYIQLLRNSFPDLRFFGNTFVATNLAVWAFGTMYPLNIAGLAESYVAAIPFFRNTLLGDMFYVTVLVGGYEAVKYWQTKRTTQEILA